MEIRKVIPTRYNNELHYKVETRVPEWKGKVYTTIARMKRNGAFENWTELYKRAGNSREEAKRSNIIISYPFDEISELEIQRRNENANLIITGIPNKIQPGVNLEELIKEHVTQEREQRPISVEIEYDENNNAQKAMATFESEEHTKEALKTANRAMIVLKSKIMKRLTKPKDQDKQNDT